MNPSVRIGPIHYKLIQLSADFEITEIFEIFGLVESGHIAIFFFSRGLVKLTSPTEIELFC